jgi:flagellar motility protein MotE (MotC chaperone)
MARIPSPRLLPPTIAAMAALLVLKCGTLVQAVVTHGYPPPDTGMVAAANAASSEEGKEHAKAPEPVKAPAAPIPDGPPPVSDSEKALLQELRQRRQDLDKRAAAVATGESVLAATEQKLTARLTELQTLQKNLEGLDSAQKQREEAGWQGLVKLYESMKPKDAATIFNDMSMPVLVQLMDRMKDSKAALVMAAMNPDKARDVTSELATMRTGRDALGAAVSAPKPSLAGN